MSRSALHYKIRDELSTTPSDFISRFRLTKSLDLFKMEKVSVKSIAYRVGFRDPNYFSRVFKIEFGMTPTEFRSIASIAQ